MRSRLTPTGLIFKWLIVPLLVGAIGYFLLGPHIGKQVVKTESTQTPVEGAVVDTRPATAPETPAVQTSPVSTPTPHHHRKRRHKPAEENSVKIDGVDPPSQTPATTP